MPPLPTDPKEYVDKWDPFNKIPPLTGTQIAFPLTNGRQIARDAAGDWLVLLQRDRHSIFLASGAGKQLIGGDLGVFPLVGAEGEALFAIKGEATGASMVVDANDKLHVIWNDESGLWYATASLAGNGLGRLREIQAWAPPRRLVGSRCHYGDIMLDASGGGVQSLLF